MSVVNVYRLCIPSHPPAILITAQLRDAFAAFLSDAEILSQASFRLHGAENCDITASTGQCCEDHFQAERPMLLAWMNCEAADSGGHPGTRWHTACMRLGIGTQAAHVSTDRYTETAKGERQPVKALTLRPDLYRIS